MKGKLKADTDVAEKGFLHLTIFMKRLFFILISLLLAHGLCSASFAQQSGPFKIHGFHHHGPRPERFA